MKSREKIAKILLNTGAVKIFDNRPFKFSSGIFSPIYIDTRILISLPREREIIIKEFVNLIKEKGIKFDIISGTATAAIPWAAFLSQKLKTPMVYVRPEPKGYGQKRQVEGVIKKGSRIFLLEDMISTAKSAVNEKKALEREGEAKVRYGAAIYTHSLQSANKAFREERIRFYYLTDFEEVVKAAEKSGQIGQEEKKEILSWSKDPVAWGKKYEGK